MAISHIPRSVGHNFLPEYQISAVPYVRSGVINTYDNGSPLTIANSEGDDQTVFVVEFPKITQWLQFKSGEEAGEEPFIYFSSKDAANKSNRIELDANRTYPLDIRCVNLYFHNEDNAKQLEIIAGLTSIDRKEFTNMIETFLEGQS